MADKASLPRKAIPLLNNLAAGNYLWSKFVPRERILDGCYRRDGPGWRLYSNPANESPSNTITGVSKIKIMTFNIWFDAFAWQQRLEELIKLIHKHQPDIVCLQEGTLCLILAVSASSRPMCSDFKSFDSSQSAKMVSWRNDMLRFNRIHIRGWIRCYHIVSVCASSDQRSHPAFWIGPQCPHFRL